MKIKMKRLHTSNLFSLKINIFIRLTFWQSPHGDYDHMGESINLVNNFKEERVIFNCGTYNEVRKRTNMNYIDKISKQ